MTDEQIVKDLECYIDEADGFYATDVLKNALNLLKRQNATIEQLEKDKESFANSYAKAVARNLTIKAEAVKEFVEKFENELTKIEEIYFDEEHENFISANKVIALLVNLVKEMEGEG